MKWSVLGFSVAVLSLTACNEFEARKPQVDVGNLNKSIVGIWASVKCENKSRKLLEFTQNEAGENVVVITNVQYNDDKCTEQNKDADSEQAVVKYKVENNRSKFAAGKLTTSTENESAEDMATIKGNKLKLGDELYERVNVQAGAGGEAAATVAAGTQAVGVGELDQDVGIVANVVVRDDGTEEIIVEATRLSGEEEVDLNYENK